MSKEKSPAFQFYPKDFISDENVAVMTNEELGVYMRLLCHCWLEKTIPADLGALERLAHTTADLIEVQWRIVGKCFKVCPEDGARLYHPRLELEREKQEEWRQKSAIGGKHSAHKRKHRKQISDEQGGCQMVPTKSQPKVNQRSTLLSAVSSLQSASAIEEKTPPLSPRGERPKDQAYELFASEFLQHRKVPYRPLKGDWVQLAALKKATECNGSPPEGWLNAIHNYFASPLGKYTLADMCSRFDIFKQGKLDRYGKPEDQHGAHQISLIANGEPGTTIEQRTSRGEKLYVPKQ